MPVNRNAYKRYLVYDKCFQKQNRTYTVRDLMHEVEPRVSRAMLYNDLAYMRSDEGFGAPIVSSLVNGVAYYTYSDPGFSIVRQPIRESEREVILETLALLGRSGGLPGFEWVQETLLRFEESLNISVQSTPVMMFQQNPYLNNIGLLGDLYRYVSQKKVLKIRYKPFVMKESRFVFHPYLLKQYNSRWYYFGWNETAAMIHNLAVDRIVSVKECDMAFRENRDIDFGEYFDDVVGVTVPEDRSREEIWLEVHPDLLPYIVTKPIHHSQTLKKRPGLNGWKSLTLKVIPNYELESLLLSFMPRIRVVSPEWLRMSMVQKLQEGLGLHEG